MNKRVYQLGEPCDVCGTPTVMGSNGPYCKACYIKWKNANGGQMPARTQNVVNKSYEAIKDKKIEEMFDAKQENIKWLNALNNACLLASTGKIEMDKIKYSAQKIYEMYPLGKESKKEEPVIDYGEELPEEIRPENIPF